MNDFDPNNIKRSDMIALADGIENYIMLLEEIMIIPKDIKKSIGKDITDAIKVSKDLIKKLRKGDQSVFKDADEWNNLF